MSKLNLIKLKIKAKHLAAEPAIIRHEESKLSGIDKRILSEHRRNEVRNEARATQLAIAYLKGKETPELKWKDVHDYKHQLVLKRLMAMVNKYGNVKVTGSELWTWMRNAK